MEVPVLLIPFAGTALGAAMVFFMREGAGVRTGKLLSGVSAGVMLAASVWSLLLPALALCGEKPYPAWAQPLAGFLAGVLLLCGLDVLAAKLHAEENSRFFGVEHETGMMLFAVILHNIPEGMAVGVAYAGAVGNQAEVSMAGVIALAVGIAIQNFPEGAIVSMPLHGAGMKKGRAFVWGALSGIVEPIGGAVIIALTAGKAPFLPLFLSFAAGAMFYVAADELIPAACTGENSRIGTCGAAAGFALMMVLDVALG